jgi:hypothetical protein
MTNCVGAGSHYPGGIRIFTRRPGETAASLSAGAIAGMPPMASVRDADIKPTDIFVLCRVLDGKIGN